MFRIILNFILQFAGTDSGTRVKRKSNGSQPKSYAILGRYEAEAENSSCLQIEINPGLDEQENVLKKSSI